MRTLLIVSVVLAAAQWIQAAAVAPAEAAAVQQEDKPAPGSGAVGDPAFPAHARVQFCLDGWLSYRGNCYFLANQVSTWGNAVSFCGSFGANLASVHNIWEKTFLQNLVKTGGHTFAWIGGYNFQGNWRWEDGSSFSYQSWDPQVPRPLQCIQLNSQESKGWSSQTCTTRLPFVCQVNPDC